MKAVQGASPDRCRHGRNNCGLRPCCALPPSDKIAEAAAENKPPEAAFIICFSSLFVTAYVLSTAFKSDVLYLQTLLQTPHSTHLLGSISGYKNPSASGFIEIALLEQTFRQATCPVLCRLPSHSPPGCPNWHGPGNTAGQRRNIFASCGRGGRSNPYRFFQVEQFCP